MRKIFLMIFAACIVTSLTSCKDKTSKVQETNSTETLTDNEATDEEVEEPVEELSYETILIEKNKKLGKSDIVFKFEVDYPTTGNAELLNEIKKNIFYMIGDSTKHDMSVKQLHNIAQKYIDDSMSEIKELDIDLGDEYAPSYGYTGSIKLDENTDKYVTYIGDSYIFSGGAHGMPYKAYLTISKKTNKALGLDNIILKNKHKELKKLLKKYIVNQYYHGEAPDWGGMFKFDIPGLAPALTVNGIIFYYGAYEIDCYAAGMPHCTIPYNKIENLMTPEAKELII